MKLIALRAGPPMASLEIFRAVLERAPANGLQVGDMRKRCRVLDLLDKATGDSIVLEDSDHQTLKSAIEGFSFGIASPALLTIVDDVLEAKAPTASVEEASGN